MKASTEGFPIFGGINIAKNFPVMNSEQILKKISTNIFL